MYRILFCVVLSGFEHVVGLPFEATKSDIFEDALRAIWNDEPEMNEMYDFKNSEVYDDIDDTSTESFVTLLDKSPNIINVKFGPVDEIIAGFNGGVPDNKQNHPPAPDDERNHPPGPDDERTHPPVPDDERNHPPAPDDERNHPPAPDDERNHSPTLDIMKLKTLCTQPVERTSNEKHLHNSKDHDAITRNHTNDPPEEITPSERHFTPAPEPIIDMSGGIKVQENISQKPKSNSPCLSTMSTVSFVTIMFAYIICSSLLNLESI